MSQNAVCHPYGESLGGICRVGCSRTHSSQVQSGEGFKAICISLCSWTQTSLGPNGIPMSLRIPLPTLAFMMQAA